MNVAFRVDHPINDIVPARIIGAKAYRITTGRFSNLEDDY